MTASVTFGGLASGLDSNSIIDKLVAVEKQPATLLQSTESAANTRISLLADLATKLTAVATAAQAVDTPDQLRGFAVAVSGSELTAAAGSTAQPGNWTVHVDQLATSGVSRSRSFTSRDAGALGTGSLSVAIGTGSAVEIDYSASDSLDDIASKFNTQVTGAHASVLDDGSGGYRIVLSADSTGSAGALHLTETGDGLGTSEVTAAKDAKVTIAGTQVTRSTNNPTDIIPGVTLHLTALTPTGSDGAIINVTRDPGAALKAVQALITAHNAVASVITAQLSYDGTTQKGADTLFGDPTVQSLERQLGHVWSSAYGGSAAADFGITVARDGTLSVDSAKFNAAFTASPANLDSFLTGDTGIAKQLTSLSTQMTQSGTGQLAVEQAGLASLNKDYDNQITRINNAADQMSTRLRAQFAAMEQAVSVMQSNLTFITNLSTGAKTS